MPKPTPDLTALRATALRLLNSGQATTTTTWRTVITDSESLTGVGLVCTDPNHPGIPDIGIERDETGAYDCCPLVWEACWESVAAYLVALLNADAEAAAAECPQNPGGGHFMTLAALGMGRYCAHCLTPDPANKES